MKTSTTAERLNQIMSERGLKQTNILDLCKPICEDVDVKLGKNDLSQYVNGKAQPGQKKLTVLARALNVSETWLMGYDVPSNKRNGMILSEKKEQPTFDFAINGAGIRFDTALFNGISNLAAKNGVSLEQYLNELIYWHIEEEMEREDREQANN